MASGGKHLQAKLFQRSQEFVVKARALGVCFECVIFLKSSRFSRCFSFPGIGCGEPFGNGAMLCAEPPGTEFARACQGCGAAEVSPVQLQVRGAALHCPACGALCTVPGAKLLWHLLGMRTVSFLEGMVMCADRK